jgi:hypothetical protein
VTKRGREREGEGEGSGGRKGGGERLRRKICNLDLKADKRR